MGSGLALTHALVILVSRKSGSEWDVQKIGVGVGFFPRRFALVSPCFSWKICLRKRHSSLTLISTRGPSIGLGSFGCWRGRGLAERRDNLRGHLWQGLTHEFFDASSRQPF